MNEAEEKKARQEWETPGANDEDGFFSILDREYRFDIDVCASAENAKCESFIGRKMDALDDIQTWLHRGMNSLHRSAWCNPGFDKPKPWVKKAFSEAQKGGVVVVLGLVSPSTEWFTFCVKNASEIRLLRPRLDFIPAPGIEASKNARDSSLVIFRPIPRNWRGAHIWQYDWRKA